MYCFKMFSFNVELLLSLASDFQLPPSQSVILSVLRAKQQLIHIDALSKYWNYK